MLRSPVIGQANVTLADVMSVAQKAKDHARVCIKKGGTQLENNYLLEEHFNAHAAAVRDLRNQVDLIQEYPGLSRFDAYITLTSKYSVGNCSEYSHQALDYMLCFDKLNLRAEAYRICGGDHAFLVINRLPDSLPEDPATWGPAAVICDPWANAVYPASEYLTKLKNFYQIQDSNGKPVKNCVEDFNPDLHALTPRSAYSTDRLRPLMNTKEIINDFASKSQRVTESLTMLLEVMSKEKIRLAKKYGDQDDKVGVLSKKILNVQASLDNIREENNLVNKNIEGGDYRSNKNKMDEHYKSIYRSAISVMKFNADEIKVLSAHKTNSAFKLKLFSIFGVRAKSERKIEAISEKISDKLNKGKFSVAPQPTHYCNPYGGWGLVFGYRTTAW